ncbi:YgiQ family radical SAM protein [Porticoccaceae bacterium]|nr:YgiQ family radical SAM protein [Porticoccaceae bacterium]MDC0010611.1 YgiQ family radical SAM protein [Porticoccaceae bacterium]MDC1452913.1 YgiQ family radical SAM protein [Porticoccaceae bacterium]
MAAAPRPPTALYDYPKYWAECLLPTPFLPMSREEMDQLGWDSCDVILVTGDAYVDHPSFGMAVIGRVLEAQGYRVGIISQPDWRDAESFRVLGKPNLYFGVTAGNMDSMINRYTADRRLRHDDAYTAGDLGGKRPDRAVTVYTQKCREAFADLPVVAGGIEASLRRLAHYDYWSESVKRSVLIDSTADILLYGNAERAMVELTHRLAKGENIRDITDLRGSAFMCRTIPEGWREIDSTSVDQPGRLKKQKNPYEMSKPSDNADAKEIRMQSLKSETCASAESAAGGTGREEQVLSIIPDTQAIKTDPSSTYIRMPSFDEVTADPVLYAHADRIFHRETNPGNARPLVQRQGRNDIWVNPPPIPLETEELDWVFDQPYKRVPHPSYGDAKIPAYDMIRFSVNIMRGCFGGCTFCSITEHEGRIIQSRSEESILNEVEKIRDLTPGFTGVISDLGGPTANMYRLNCKDKKIEATCRRPSCVYPSICVNLETDHKHTTQLYRKTRALEGVKKVVVASGLRYDLAVLDPEYVKELVTHHVGGYLKIAPEHSEDGPLSKMMKPGMGSYYEFKEMFERFSKEAGKKQYLIPYFISAHPGSTNEDMMALGLWLKANGFRVDQVQSFYPSPMASATTMYYTEKNPLKPLGKNNTEQIFSAKTQEQRTLHKAFLRYHDAENWPMLRKALRRMGRSDLIGSGDGFLVPGESRREKEVIRRESTKARPNLKAQPRSSRTKPRRR